MILFDEVEAEMLKGERRYGVHASLHEAYAVLLEEVDELKQIVWKKATHRDPYEIRREAIQIAAVALRIAQRFGEGEACRER